MDLHPTSVAIYEVMLEVEYFCVLHPDIYDGRGSEVEYGESVVFYPALVHVQGRVDLTYVLVQNGAILVVVEDHLFEGVVILIICNDV